MRILISNKIKSMSESKQESSPSDSRVNFVVPSLPTLRKEFDSSDPGCENPGLIYKNIDAYAQQTENGKSYKICFDDKQICQGFGTKLGEVDLFGYESKPTLKEKQQG